MKQKLKRICKECGIGFEVYPSYIKFSPANFCSVPCMGKAKGKSQIGKNNHAWKGDKVGIDGIHTWLMKQFGKADRCENPNCKGTDKYRFEWAKLEDKKYERKRENFWRLCVTCHRTYDFTKDKFKNMFLACIGRKHTFATRRKMSLSAKGHKNHYFGKKKIW